MRGRKPKPVEQQIAAGDPRKHGKNKLEERRLSGIKAAPGFILCPKHLAGEARRAWKFLTDELQAMQLDKRPDSLMLEGICRHYDRAVQADAIVSKEGPVLEEGIFDKEGNEVGHRLKKHPAVEISNRSWLIVKAFCTEFGLSPVSRTRLQIEKKPDQDTDLMALLGQPRQKKPTPEPMVN